MNCVSYIRVSTDKQHVENQRFEINNYCKTNNLTIIKEIALNVSSRKSLEERQVNVLLDLPMGSIIVTSELSRLGRSTVEVITLVDDLLDKGIALHIIRQGMKLTKHDPTSRMMITLFSCFSQLERDFISQRTKQALAARKAAGHKLGRQTSERYAEAHGNIMKMHRKGDSYNTIAEALGLTKSGVVKYIRRNKK